MSDPKKPSSSPGDVASRSVLRIGEVARRIGRFVSDVSDAVSFSEAFRTTLRSAQLQRDQGNVAGAAHTLLLARDQRHTDALSLSAALLYGFDALDPVPSNTVLSPTEDGELKTLAEGGVGKHFEALREAMRQNDAERALDALRRADLSKISLPDDLRQRARLLAHLWATLCHSALGRPSRVLLELERCDASLRALDEGWAYPLQIRFFGLGVQAALQQGDIQSIEALRVDLRGLSKPALPEERQDAQEIFQKAHDQALRHELRLSIVRGDQSLLQANDSLRWPEIEARAQIAGLLPLSPPGSPRRSTGEQKALNPYDHEHWRLIMARSVAAVADHRKSSEELKSDWQRCQKTALEQLQAIAAPQRRSLVAEICFFCLASSDLDFDLSPLQAEIKRQQKSAPAELLLALAQRNLKLSPEQSEALQREIASARNELALRWSPGLDESSPLRFDHICDPVHESVIGDLQGRIAQARHDIPTAQAAHARALALWPAAVLSQRALLQLSPPLAGNRLEDHLRHAYEELALARALSNESQTILRRCQHALVLERERLARPFTLAVMGEFSAGKSTFVNALIGRKVAPMGVLPTTNTVNRFRHGSGTIRVHYEDGRIQFVHVDQSHDFLESIDEREAREIQYLDIEGNFDQLADMMVVDTPGLNATQAHHAEITERFVDQADAIIWIFSATRAGAASEAKILQFLHEEDRPILGVLNKIDTLNKDEQVELITYLQEQFGNVLLDVLPADSHNALQGRLEGGHPEALAILGGVQAGLRSYLLDRGPELKRELAAQRGIHALTRCQREIEIRLSEISGQKSPVSEVDINAIVMSWLGELTQVWLDLDDLLVREALSLGLVASGSGRTSIPMSDDDRRYLFRAARRRFLGRADQLLREDASVHPEGDPTQPVAAAVREWLGGFWAGLETSDCFGDMVEANADVTAEGESALREAIRASLREYDAVFSPQSASLAQLIRNRLRTQQQRRARGDLGHRVEYQALREVWLPRIARYREALQGWVTVKKSAGGADAAGGAEDSAERGGASGHAGTRRDLA